MVFSVAGTIPQKSALTMGGAMHNPYVSVAKIWLFLLIVFVGLLFALPARGDSIEDAKAAFENGDFDGAVGILIPL